MDRDLATQWLNEHLEERRCPTCHQESWGMLEQLVQQSLRVDQRKLTGHVFREKAFQDGER
jgi:hypothetical protein